MEKNTVKAICIIIVVLALIGLIVLKLQDNVRWSEEQYAKYLQQRQQRQQILVVS